MLAVAFLVGSILVGTGYSIYREPTQTLTFGELITYYVKGAHPDDIHKEILPIKQKQLQKFLRESATKNRIYVPPEIVKLISNFSALNLRKEKKLNKLRDFRMYRKLNAMLYLAYWEKEGLKEFKYHVSLKDVLFAQSCRIIRYDFKSIEYQKLRRKVEFDAEVNLLMLYSYATFERLFSFKKDSKKELKVFSMFHEKPLARMKLLEKRRWRINKNEATRLVKQLDIEDIKRNFLTNYKTEEPQFYDQTTFNYKALPNLPQQFS